MSEARDMNKPQPGWWLVRPVSRGDFVPACIRWVETTHEPGNPENLMERSRSLGAFVNETPVALEEVWHRRGLTITEEEYNLAILDAMAGIYEKRKWTKRERDVGA